jgi:hypothetical protein
VTETTSINTTAEAEKNRPEHETFMCIHLSTKKMFVDLPQNLSGRYKCFGGRLKRP